MKTQDIFNNFLTEIADSVSPTTYGTWFNQLELISMDDKNITIKVPLPVHKQILKLSYADLIDDTLYSLTGIHYEINLVTEDEIEKNNDIIPKTSVDTEQTIEWNTNLNPNLNFDNYVVGESNRLAFISAMNVAQSPRTIRNPLFIYGRSGIGKTHLMHAIGNYITKNSNKKVLYTTSNDFRDEYVGISKLEKGKDTLQYATNFKNKYRNVDVLIIDDIQ